MHRRLYCRCIHKLSIPALHAKRVNDEGYRPNALLDWLVRPLS
jgi:hypothetical protein